MVDYVSDILAFNSATSAAGALLPAASDTIAARLKGVWALHCMAAFAVLGDYSMAQHPAAGCGQPGWIGTRQGAGPAGPQGSLLKCHMCPT